MSHSVGGAQRLRTDPFQVEIELRVGITRRELRGEFQRQRSLAHATKAGDGHAALLDCHHQLSEFFRAPGEVQRWRRELVQGRGDLARGLVDILISGDDLARDNTHALSGGRCLGRHTASKTKKARQVFQA